MFNNYDGKIIIAEIAKKYEEMYKKMCKTAFPVLNKFHITETLKASFKLYLA